VDFTESLQPEMWEIPALKFSTAQGRIWIVFHRLPEDGRDFLGIFYAVSFYYRGK